MAIMQTDAPTIWNDVLHDLELVISRGNFTTWFKNTHGLRIEDGVFFVGVPNEFYREWLSTKFHKEILKALRHHNEQIRSAEYTISKSAPVVVATKPNIAPPQPTQAPVRELPLEMTSARRDNLNPKYTFENFIIGPFNEVAYSASQAILKQPGVYNPLFIYGSTGLGKTHLIQAVGNAMKAKNPNISINYTNSEKFTNDVVGAIQSNKIATLKEKYRAFDVFILDDIQFLSNRDKTQEELFHLFNVFFDKGKQVIFSSDKHPNYILGLEDRLKSRLSQGMIIDISKPEYESRVAILQAKALENKLTLPPDVVDYIAQHVEGNIRELEGIFNSLTVAIQAKKRDLDVNEVKTLIKNNIKPKKNVSIEEIIKTIAHFYNLTEDLIYEKTRRKEIVRARQIAMYLLREDFNISFPLIGRKMGGRDHTTVIHSCEKVKADLLTDPEIGQEVEQLRAMLSV